jgi:type II secretory pathway component HofQ
MKTAIITLFATLAMTASGTAAPQYLVESTVVTRNARGEERLTAPRVVVGNGQQATIQIGDRIKYAVTPEVRDNGTVDLSLVLIESSYTNKTEKLTGFRVTTRLGKETQMRIGKREFTTRTSLPK